MTDKRKPESRYPDDTYLQTAEEDDARLQPDPELALSGGRASRTQIWLAALSAVVIAGLVLYGISRTPDESQTAATPPAQTTTGAAPSSEPPAAPEKPAQEPNKPADSAR
jgi:hypothetical protein